MLGDLVDESFHSRIFDGSQFLTVDPTVGLGFTAEGKSICYHISNVVDAHPTVLYDLCYVLSGSKLKFVFKNVSEPPGYKLIHVRSPELVTIRGTQLTSDGAAKIGDFGLAVSLDRSRLTRFIAA